MPFETQNSDWLKLPKQGESYDFSQHGEVTEIKKVDNKEHRISKFNFTKKEVEKVFDSQGNEREIETNVDLGYFYQIIFSDGKKLSLSQWQPFYAMEKAGIVEGVKFELAHPAKGEWKVEIK